MFHGSPVHPAKIAREGLKPKSQSVDSLGVSLYKHKVFATPDRDWAGYIGTVGHKKAFIYSTNDRKLKWNKTTSKTWADPEKDGQSVSKKVVHPTHVQQVERKSDTISPKQKLKYGHKWKLKSGSLPKHTSIQQQRTSLHTRRH